MAEIYITEEQRAKCRKVADAFAELYGADGCDGGGCREVRVCPSAMVQ